MSDIIKLYWRALSGFRRQAAVALASSALSGMLEGTAIMVLAPILGRGIALAGGRTSARYEQIYQALHIPQDHRLTYVFCAFIFIGLLSAFMHLLADALMLRLHSRIEQSFRTRMGNAFFQMSWPQFLIMGTGDIGKAVFMEGLHAGDGCRAFIQTIGYSLIAMNFIGFSLCISVPLTMITFAFGAVASIAYFWGGRRAERHARVLVDHASTIGKRASEIFQNLKFVRASGWTAAAKDETNRLYAEYAWSNIRSNIYQYLIRSVYESAGIILIAGFLAFGFFWSGKSMEWAIVFLAVFYRLAPRVQLVQDCFYSVRVHAPWVADWHKRYDQALANADRTGQRSAILTIEALEIRDAVYQYPRTSVHALQAFELRVRQGQCIALIGESGSGKSTALDLITGLIQPSSGLVTLNGTPLPEIDLESWRKRIGLVLQGSPLFYGSILKNISWGDPQPDLNKATQCAQLANAWEFIERLPEGIQTEMEEKGGRFSGGQRQRIALARALYRNPWLLILDEPTSELDAESEDWILKALQTIKGRYAMIITSHRLKLARLADEILVLERGRTVERGSWEALTANSQSIFQRMANQQSL